MPPPAPEVVPLDRRCHGRAVVTLDGRAALDKKRLYAGYPWAADDLARHMTAGGAALVLVRDGAVAAFTAYALAPDALDVVKLVSFRREDELLLIAALRQAAELALRPAVRLPLVVDLFR